ncbi:MAG: protein kinase [Planctomycetota bacterium]
MNEPRRVGPWTLERELGRGSYGAVFLAHREGGAPAALKVLLDLSDPEQLARFEREAQVTARLSHPGIVRVLDFGLAQGRPYLAMEYVAGETLADRLARGPLPPADAVACLREVAAAVAHAHAHGILHRDLKPANVLLEWRRAAPPLEQHDASGVAERSSASAPANVLLPEGDLRRPRVTDFGMARDLYGGRLTRTGDVLGTPYYMAPEQLEGRTDVDGRVDVWALGVILYQALSGGVPFTGPNLPALAWAVQQGPPPLPAETPAMLEDLVRAALAVERAARPATVEDFARELARAELGASTEGGGGRRPLALALSVGALLAALVGGAAATFALQGVPEREDAERREREALEARARVEAQALARAEAALRARRQAEQRGAAAREALAEAVRASRATGPGLEPFEAGRARFDEAVRLARGDEAFERRARYERAHYAFRRGRFRAALEEAQALSDVPGRLGLDARFLCGLVGLWDDQDARDGVERLERIWRDDPEGTVGLSAGATFHSYSGKNEVGERMARRSLELDPDNVETMIGLAFCLNDLGRRDEALAMVQRALVRAPDHLRAWNCMTMVRLGRRELREARATTGTILTLAAPTPPPRVLSFHVEVCAVLGEWEEVIATATRLIEANQGGGREYIRRAQGYEIQGRTELADRDWRLLVTRRELFNQALSELPRPIAGRVLERLGLR